MSSKTLRLSDAAVAASLLREGKTVAFPTETVFGLGANALSAGSVERIFRAKGRPADNPLIVHLGASQDLPMAVSEVTQVAQDLLAAFSPGPITVVLPKCAEIPDLVTGGLDTVAVRIPSCPIAQQVIQESRRPIAAPSANRSGRPSSTRWQSVLEDLDGRIDAILCKESATIGLESTVVDCTGDVPVLLRPGAITLPDLQRIHPGAKSRCDAVPAELESLPNSPGLRHPHYRPNAKVLLYERADGVELSDAERTQAVFLGLSEVAQAEDCLWTQTYPDLDAYAAHFYEALREADRLGAKVIVLELAPNQGIGAALRDRQLRAAGHK